VENNNTAHAQSKHVFHDLDESITNLALWPLRFRIYCKPEIPQIGPQQILHIYMLRAGLEPAVEDRTRVRVLLLKQSFVMAQV